MIFLCSYPNITIAGAFAFVFSCFYLLSSKYVKYKRAPEPRGGWPLFGHFPMIARSQLPHVTLGALADKYGPIFTLRLGLRRALVVSDSELAKEIFTTYDKAVTARPKLVAAKYLTYNYAMFPFTPSGLYWKDMRKFSISELLSNHRLEQIKNVLVQEVGNYVKQLYKNWEEDKRDDDDHHQGQVLVNLNQWFGDLNLDVIMRLITGKRFFVDGSVGEIEKGRRCQKAIRELFRYWGLLVLRDAVPFLGWLDVGGHEKEMKRVAKEVDEFAEEWLEEHKRKDEGQRDFMEVMSSFLDGKSCGDYDADTINKATSLSMIAGGNETTSVVLVWAAALLVNNPHVLRKAQEELDTHVGKDRLVNDKDINKLVYLQAIVKEALRLYPPASLPAPRQFLENCTISGYFVPKGTWLIVNLRKIQTDPRVWPDPLEFKPERFLTTHKNVDVRGQNFEITPFGCGRRACPAVSFALKMLHLTLATLLHAFNISAPGNSPVDMTQKSGLTNVKASPLEVLVSPRLSSKCFQ